MHADMSDVHVAFSMHAVWICVYDGDTKSVCFDAKHRIPINCTTLDPTSSLRTPPIPLSTLLTYALTQPHTTIVHPASAAPFLPGPIDPALPPIQPGRMNLSTGAIRAHSP